MDLGRATFPSGIYLKLSGFSIMFWVKNLLNIESAEFMRFGVSNNQDLFMFYIPHHNKERFLLVIRDGSLDTSLKSYTEILDSSTVFGKWVHFAFTFTSTGKIGKFYLNGLEMTSEPYLGMREAERNLNRINNVKAVLDELKIFGRTLSSDEIVNEMSKNQLYSDLET